MTDLFSREKDFFNSKRTSLCNENEWKEYNFRELDIS